LRPAGGGDLICAHVAAARLVKKGKKLTFRDRKHKVAEADGLDALTLAKGKKGPLRLKAVGKRLAFTTPSAGQLELTIALRAPSSTGTTNQCAGRLQAFRGVKKQAIVAP